MQVFCSEKALLQGGMQLRGGVTEIQAARLTEGRLVALSRVVRQFNCTVFAELVGRKPRKVDGAWISLIDVPLPR